MCFSLNADHPHGRGENVPSRLKGGNEVGPSPRAWGEPTQMTTGWSFTRTILTGVGRTNSGNIPRCWRADHPHGRGENSALSFTVSVMVGPSPRAWGELASCAEMNAKSRTIPTGVGRTLSQSRDSISWADHPHGRGENLLMARRFATACGPSPRAWGEPMVRYRARAARRTIPTGVGRTAPAMNDCPARTDHPHGRGENPSRAML